VGPEGENGAIIGVTATCSGPDQLVVEVSWWLPPCLPACFLPPAAHAIVQPAAWAATSVIAPSIGLCSVYTHTNVRVFVCVYVWPDLQPLMGPGAPTDSISNPAGYTAVTGQYGKYFTT
jgi:hypothetical protein